MSLSNSKNTELLEHLVSFVGQNKDKLTLYTWEIYENILKGGREPLSLLRVIAEAPYGKKNNDLKDQMLAYNKELPLEIIEILISKLTKETSYGTRASILSQNNITPEIISKFYDSFLKRFDQNILRS